MIFSESKLGPLYLSVALLSWFLPALCPSLPAAADTPRHLIKLASIAPEGSSWVKAVRAIDREVRQRTGEAVGFKIYPGGVQGDDSVVLRKMRIGQLQAAGFAGQGTATIFPDVLALEMPFLFDDYEEVDYVLEQMEEFYSEGLKRNGYVLLGWADIGFVHILSKHPIRNVADIRQRKVWRLEDEPITHVLFRKAGVTSVPLNIPDVLLGLQTNLIDVAYAPPAAAIVMQWFTRVKFVTELPINYTLGALLVDARVFSKLSPEHQQILKEVSSAQMRQLSMQARRENEEALQVMLDNGLELVKPDPEDVKAFQKLVDESVPELVGKSFSQESYDLVNSHLQTIRQRRAQIE